MLILDLDQKFDHRIYTYNRQGNNKMCVLQGVSAEQKGSYQVTLDSALTQKQTVILGRGDDWELVLELRPRRFSELEKIRMAK